MSLACLVGVKDVCCTLVSCQWTIMAEHDLSSWRWIPLDESFLIRLHVYNWKHVTVYFFFFAFFSLFSLSSPRDSHYSIKFEKCPSLCFSFKFDHYYFNCYFCFKIYF
jgi:hypothetical protein